MDKPKLPLNRAMRRKKRWNHNDLFILAEDIALMSDEEQLKYIHKVNPYWVMPKEMKDEN